VFYTRGEWTQGDGNLNENGGLGLTPPVQRRTDDSRFFQKYVAGLNWYPLRRLSLDAQYYYKINRYDYDHRLDSTPNGPASGNAYPAYLVMQDFTTHDANARLTLRPLHNLTLVSRYDFQLSTVDTRPDSVSGLAEIESSQVTSHVFAQNINWAPWTRLYLQLGFSYVLSKTETPASPYTQAVLDANNNYWTLNCSSGFVLTQKTDLNLGYYYYRADDYSDNSAFGVPYGAGAEEHSVTCGLTRRLSENLRLNLRYGYSRYRDETSGGHSDYDAHLVFASLQYRF
jgi:hypothetical protein